MIHIFNIEKEADLSNKQESINESLLTLGICEIIMEQTSSVGLRSFYFDQHTERNKTNSNVDSMDSFPLNDTFDKHELKTLSIQSGSFQKNLPSQVVNNKKMIAFGRTFSISSITNANPGKVICLEEHGLKDGQKIILSRIEGSNEMVDLNNQTITVTNILGEPTNFTIGINTTSYGSHTSETGIVTPIYLIGLDSQSVLNKEIDDNPNSYSSWSARNNSQFSYDTESQKVVNHDEDYISSTNIEDWTDISNLTNRFSGKFYEFFSTFDSPGNIDYFKYDYTLTKEQDFIDLKKRIDSLEGLTELSYVVVATTENINLTGLQTIDGISLSEDDRVLVKDQTDSSENGIYIVDSGAWTRSLDENTWSSFIDAVIPVIKGTNNKNTKWVSNAGEDETGVLDTTDLEFVQFSLPELALWLKNKDVSYYDTDVVDPEDIKIKVAPGLIPFNVQEVLYSDESVFVKSTGLPSYIDSDASLESQNWIFEIPRKPLVTDNKFFVSPLIGVLKNGVALATFRNGSSYRNLNFWNINTVAYGNYDENGGSDTLGYSHSYLPPKLHNLTLDDAIHSPLLGYALDGHPIYGPYAYTDKNPESTSTSISKMVSGYRLRNILDRSTLPNGIVLNPSQYGPEIPSYDYIVELATTMNLNFTYLNKQGNNATLTNQKVGEVFIDGVKLLFGYKILVKNQTNPAVNGVYEVTVEGSVSTYATLVRLPIHDTNLIKSREKGRLNLSNYGYNNKNGNKVFVNSGIKNLNTSWILDGGESIGITPISATSFEAYPLGYFVEDYEYVEQDDDLVLDEYNGRFGRTPEYPGGVYAYFMTTNITDTPAFPYIIGGKFYGVPSSGVFGHSIVYGKTKNYINKVEKMNIRILETNKIYYLKTLNPEEWEVNNSFVSYLGEKNKNFFYNKTVGLNSFINLELIKDLSFDESIEKTLQFSGNIQSLEKRTDYETVTGADIPGEYVNIDNLRTATSIFRANPSFDELTGTWNPVVLNDDDALVHRFYRTTTANESYEHDFSNTSISVSRRLDSIGTPNPLSVKMYSTYIIESNLNFTEILSDEGWEESDYAEDPESFWDIFV